MKGMRVSGLLVDVKNNSPKNASKWLTAVMHKYNVTLGLKVVNREYLLESDETQFGVFNSQ